MVKSHKVADNVSFDINPTSRDLLEELIESGELSHLIHAGARLHQAGCNGCIGMGQAPASGRISLRTVPRNFPGRSGTKEDQVYLCSPETAAASALTGVITDPRRMVIPYPTIKPPPKRVINQEMLIPPLAIEEARNVVLEKGSNIVALPDLDSFPDELELPILLKVKDDISTDEIMPAGARVLPYRSNIPKISEYAFEIVDPTYAKRARAQKEKGNHTIIGGQNYGQGSSREHAALAPRYLGLRMVIAQSFARIHLKNLINFGILPVTLDNSAIYDKLEQDDIIVIDHVHKQLQEGNGKLNVRVPQKDLTFTVSHTLTPRLVEILFSGGLTNWVRNQSHITA